MARRRPTRSATKSSGRSEHRDVTHRQFEVVLAIIERNTTRIDRLEDVFAMHAKERAGVKQDLEAIKTLLKDRRRIRR